LVNHSKAYMIFVTVGVLDFLFATILIILMVTNKLTYKEPNRGKGVEEIIREMNQ